MLGGFAVGVWKSLVAPTLGGKQLWADVFVHDGYRIQRNVFNDHHRLLGPDDRRRHWGNYEACLQAYQQAPREPWQDGTHVVFLLHGYLRAKDAFGPMATALNQAGYAAAAVNYPSMWRGLGEHAEQLGRVLDRLRGRYTVSFVGHSLGGLIARKALADGGAWQERLEVNRLVMLGVPNQGAELADLLSGTWLSRAMGGPSLAQLTTTSVPGLPGPSCAFGLVSGVRGNGEGWNPLIEGEDDGIVSLASTRLDGAEDSLEVSCVHALLMRQPRVIEATLSYLRTGRFRPGSQDSAETAALG